MTQILLVDDSETILLSMGSVLSRVGYQPEKRLSGETAVEYLDNGGQPALTITDLNMPGMNGIDFIREARRRPETRFTPILMLTTESAQEACQEAKAAGAIGWLVKPVLPTALLDVVKQVLPAT